MTPNEAIETAKGYVADLYKSERITNLGLEEIRFDGPDIWEVTIGFTRDWDKPYVSALERVGSTRFIPPQAARTYKLVRLRDRDGSVVEMLNRPIAA